MEEALRGEVLKLEQLKAEGSGHSAQADPPTQPNLDSHVEDHGAESPLEEDSLAGSGEMAKLQVVVQYLRDACTFCKAVQRAVHILTQLLGSKTASDAVEAINGILTAAQFKAQRAEEGIRKMLVLIWSKEAPVKQAVLDAYRKIYFSPDPAVHTSAKARASFVVDSLLSMTTSANLGDIKSIEKLVGTMMEEKIISESVVKLLWDTFARSTEAQPATGTTDTSSTERQRGAVMVLAMAARADPNIIKSNVGLLVASGLGTLAV
jgi:condensin complex subunit 1